MSSQSTGAIAAGRKPADLNRGTVSMMFETTFSLTKQSFLHGLLFFIVVVVLFFLVANLFLGASVAALSGDFGQQLGRMIVGVGSLPGLISFVVLGLVLFFWVTTVMARMALRYRGEDSGFLNCLTFALRRFPRFMVVSVLAFGFMGLVLAGATFAMASSGGSGGGIFLFVVALIFLYWLGLRLLPVAAVAMTENEAGIFGSLTRGFQLSGGRWWTIFGLNFLIGLVMGGLQLVSNLTLQVPYLGLVVVAVLFYLEMLIMLCSSMAIYVELVARKEGAPSGDVAAVFD